MNKFKLLVGFLTTLISSVSATSGIVQAEGDHFVVDGCKQYFSGTNNYRTLAICDKHDIRVIRSWAFIDEEEKAGYITQKFENGK
ncbi:glycoside hydrolase family 5 protein, partial [Piromyces sp. E2]